METEYFLLSPQEISSCQINPLCFLEHSFKLYFIVVTTSSLVHPELCVSLYISDQN